MLGTAFVVGSSLFSEFMGVIFPVKILQKIAFGAVFVGDISKRVKRFRRLPTNFTLAFYSPIIQIAMRLSMKIGWVIATGLLALLVRLPGLGQFMTADEENWMLRSAGFYHNLFRNGDTGGTFMTTHPGATTMWLAGAGIVLQEYRLGYDIDSSNLIHFRKSAVLPVTIAISILIGITAWHMGMVAGMLLALEPYLVGMSQIVHLDMLLALFMLNSALAFLGDKKITAGVFWGLALATKVLPALWLFVFFGLFLGWKHRWQASEIIRQFGFLVGVAALTFWVTWPALWFTADLGRSFAKDIPNVIQDAHVAIEKSEEPIEPASFYIRTFLGRTTPFVLILIIASVIVVSQEKKRGPVFWLLMYTFGFLIFITIAAKKADRYALPALVALPVIAGLALPKLKWVVAVAGFLLLAQLWLWSPHAIAYNSFFKVRPASQQGWGEGLEEAAAWLNERPDVENLYVASWYPGVLGTYFQGKTLSLSSRNDDRVGFVVLYRNMHGRGAEDLATNILDEFEDKTPTKVISIQNLLYVWIYDIRGLYYFPNHVGELFGGKTVGQLVPIQQNVWNAIEIGLATFSSRQNTQDIILHVREGLESSEDIRTISVNASVIQDGSYHRFEFWPIENSASKTFYVWLESPASQPGNAVTVRFANDNLLPGEMVKDGSVLSGRDMAYKIPDREPEE